MSFRTGTVACGLGVTSMGGVSLTLGLLRSPLLPPSLLGASGTMLATAGGAALVLSGVLLAASSVRRAPEAAAVVPAHVAFISRAPRAAPMPDPVVVPQKRRAPTRTQAAQAQMSKLDDEIRELTRRINKAGVLLATGQISHQGYASYVEELKQKRGALEASRVRLEMHPADAAPAPE